MYVLLIGTAYFCLLMFVFLDSCPCASLSTFSPLPYSPPHTHVHVRIIIMSNCCSLSFLYSVGLSHVFSLSCVNTVSVSVRNCTIPYTYINVCCYCHYYIIILLLIFYCTLVYHRHCHLLHVGAFMLTKLYQ